MKRDKRCKLLRQYISRLDFGKEVVTDGCRHPIHVNTCRKIEFCFNWAEKTEWWRHLDRLDNADFADHFAGRETFYFVGNDCGSKSLVMVDVDCKRRGSLAGAMAYCKNLSETLLPGMPRETSTHGRGGHGYFIVDWGCMPICVRNEILKDLEKRLRQEIAGFDIENVEIKGLMPRLEWDNGVMQITEGTLAKLPRTLSYDDLRNLPVINVTHLVELTQEFDEDYIAPTATGRDPETKRPVAPAGSIAGKHITPEMLTWLPKYEKLADTLMEHHPLPVSSGRGVATSQDLACLMLLLEFFADNPNVDGSMPFNRIKGMWEALHQAGDFERKWDDKRYATARNYLSSLGLIKWQDATYKPGYLFDGNYCPGRAAKWCISARLRTMLSTVKAEEERSSDIQGRGESSLSVTRILELVLSLEQKTPAETTRPVLEDEIRLSADEITAKVTPFEEWAMAA